MRYAVMIGMLAAALVAVLYALSQFSMFGI